MPSRWCCMGLRTGSVHLQTVTSGQRSAVFERSDPVSFESEFPRMWIRVAPKLTYAQQPPSAVSHDTMSALQILVVWEEWQYQYRRGIAVCVTYLSYVIKYVT